MPPRLSGVRSVAKLARMIDTNPPETATRRSRLLVSAAVAAACAIGTLAIGVHQASASYTAGVQAGTLQITGDKASDKLRLAATPTALLLDVGDDGTVDFSFDPTPITAINVAAGGGDDEVAIDNAVSLFAARPLTVDGGAGNDRLIGGAGPETLIGGTGNDFVDGNIGADTARLGTGNDTFQWDPGDGSDTVDGDGGTDALAFNGSNAAENIDVEPNGSRVLLTRNVAAITMDLGGIETAAIRALGSADNVTVGSLGATDLKTVDVDLGSFDGSADGAEDHVFAVGTEQADSVTVGASGAKVAVNGLGSQVLVTSAEASDHVGVETLGGDDTVTGGVTIPGPGAVDVDGGTGNDTTTFRGSGGDDNIGIARNGTAAAAFTPAGTLVDVNTESLNVLGLGGNDTLAGQNGIGAITHLTVDGGAGDDTVRGGDGADTLLGGTGNDLVDGNIGADTADLGTGNDTFEWDPGDGSDTVEGSDGKDAVAFNGSNIGERVELGANGSRVRLTRDVAAVTMDFAGIEAANVRVLGGADTVTVDDLKGTQLKTVDTDLTAFDGTTDGAEDHVVANATDKADSVTVGASGTKVAVNGLAAQVLVTTADASDNVDVEGLDGDDTIVGGVTIPGTGTVNANGGPGTDATVYNGSAGDDTIGIARNGTQVAAFTTTGALMDANTESLKVLGLGGDDALRGQNGIGALTQLTLDGGAGDDTVAGGDGADLLLGGTGNDLVDGNIGADTARLGTGNDTFQWDPGDGNDTVEGEAGTDQLAFNGSNIGEDIELGANGSRVRLTRNVAAIAMDFAGIEGATVRALGGADNVIVDSLAGTGLKTVDADLSAFDGNGDGAVDSVTVNGTDAADKVAVTTSGSQVLTTGLAAQTRISGSEVQNDTLFVKTLAGKDSVTVAPDIGTLINSNVDLGADN